MSKNALALVLCGALVGALATGWLAGTSTETRTAVAASHEAHEHHGRIFEMRTYTTKPGLLPNLHERFRNHTNYLFVKHGMSLVAYWTPTDKPETLVYVLAYPSKKARETSWDAFKSDPVWKAAFKASHEKAGGSLLTKVESEFLHATDYSPLR